VNYIGWNFWREFSSGYVFLHIGTVPSYLAETLHSTADIGSRRRLWSASKSTLVIPTTWRTTLGDRAFPVTAARAWNALPSSVCSAPSLLQFRRDLKTALFQSSYSSPYCSAVWQTVTVIYCKVPLQWTCLWSVTLNSTLTLHYIHSVSRGRAARDILRIVWVIRWDVSEWMTTLQSVVTSSHQLRPSRTWPSQGYRVISVTDIHCVSRTVRTGCTDVSPTRTGPVGIWCWRRADEHQSTSVLEGLSCNLLDIIQEKTSLMQTDRRSCNA